jgi:hypothetical protein
MIIEPWDAKRVLSIESIGSYPKLCAMMISNIWTFIIIPAHEYQ